MHHPLVSVIIATYNRPEFVVEALESVLAQTYSPIEIVVVDDGSDPATAAALAPYMSRIRYLYQSQSGPAAARNRGLREARGEFLAILDDDDKWLPQKLHRQMEFLNSYPDVGLVHTETLLWDYRTDVFEQKEGSIRDKYVGWCFDLLFLYGNSIMPSTVLLRRQCMERVGLFAEEFRTVADDYDFFLRFAKHFKIGFIREPLVHYRLHNQNLSKNALARAECDLRVVDRALRSDGSLWESLGKRKVSERLYNLCLFAGYLHLDNENFSAARCYFRRAARYHSANVRLWGLCLATMLPIAVVREMKSFRSRVGAALSSS